MPKKNVSRCNALVYPSGENLIAPKTAALPTTLLAASAQKLYVHSDGRELLDSPAAAKQLLSGFYEVQGDAWRWMGPSGSAMLAIPESVESFRLDLYVPDNSPARQVRVEAGGRLLLERTLNGPGGHVVEAPIQRPPGDAARIVVRAQPAFFPPGDERELSIVVNSFGFQP